MMRHAIALILAVLLSLDLSRASELGRLFFTPAQREAIDKTVAQPQAEATTMQALRLDGIVHRPHAAPIIWLNGQRLTQQLAGQKAGPDSLQFIDAQGRAQHIRVGESILVAQRLDAERKAP